MTATATPSHEEKIAKLNAELNGHRDQTPNLPPGETVESLIAKEDKKIDLTKIKLFKEVDEQAPTPKKEGAPELVDPDAPLPDKIAAKKPEEHAVKKTLKQRAEDHETLARRQADKFRRDTKAKEEAAAARAEAAAAKAEAARVTEQNARTLALLEEATKSPEAALAFVAKHGVNAVTLAKAAVDQGKTPAQVAKSAIEEKIDAVLEENKRLKAEETARKAKEAETAAAKAQADKYEADKATFVANFTENSAAKYPTLAKLVGDKPEKIVARFIGFVHSLQAEPETAAELQANKDKYTDEVLLALFEKVTARDLAAANKASADNTTGQTTEAAPGKTKTGSTATTRRSSKRLALPANFDKLSDSEQNRLMAEYASKYAIKTE